MASYYPISPRFWSDPLVRSWSDESRLLALYLLTCRHRSLEGLYWLPPEYAAADLGWSVEKVAGALQQLEADGFARVDSGAQVVLVCNALKYQPPKGAKQIAGALSALEQLPDTWLLGELVRLAKSHSQALADALSKRYPAIVSVPEIPHRRGIEGVSEVGHGADGDENAGGIPHRRAILTGESTGVPSPSLTPSPSLGENCTVEPERLDLSQREQEQQVFDTWIQATGRTGRTVFDAKRRRLVQRALDAFPLQDVCDAVRGWRLSPHHRGENGSATTYNDLELLLRDSAHIEKFRDLQRSNAQADPWLPSLLAEHPCSEDSDTREAWSTVLASIEQNHPSLAVFLDGSHPHAGAEDGTLLLGVKPETRNWIEERFGAHLSTLAGQVVQLLPCPTLERSAA